MYSNEGHALVRWVKDGEDMLVEGGWGHLLCTGGHQADGIHRVQVVAHGVVTMLVSLAVDILMRSQEKARVFREEDTNDARSSSMVV